MIPQAGIAVSLRLGLRLAYDAPGVLHGRRDLGQLAVGLAHQRQGAAGTGRHAQPTPNAAVCIQGNAVPLGSEGLHLAPFQADPAALAGIGLLYSIRDPFLEVRKTLLCIPLFLAPLVLMVLVRDSVRRFYLHPHFQAGEFQSQSQWGPMVLFLVLLGIAVPVLIYLVWRISRSRPDTDLRSSPLAG